MLGMYGISGDITIASVNEYGAEVQVRIEPAMRRRVRALPPCTCPSTAFASLLSASEAPRPAGKGLGRGSAYT